MRLYYGQKVRVYWKGPWRNAQRQAYPAMITDRIEDLHTHKESDRHKGSISVQIFLGTRGKGRISVNMSVPPEDIKV